MSMGRHSVPFGGTPDTPTKKSRVAVLPPPDDIPPWERQRGEHARTFHNFCHYRDLGAKRSVDKAWRLHKEMCEHKPVEITKRAPYGGWHQSCAEWGWVERAEAWDRSQDALAREKLTKERLEAAERHAKMAQAALSVLSIPSRVLLEAIQQDPLLVQNLVKEARSSPKAAIKLIDLVSWATKGIPGLVDVERLSRGMSTEVIEIGEKRDELGLNFASDPEATELALALLDRYAGARPSDTGGPGSVGDAEGDGGAVVHRGTPEDPDPSAD